MYSLEFVSGRPLGSAQYYSLVVREPYVVGRDRESDIVLDHDDIVADHALLTVVRESQALEHQQRRLLEQGINVNTDSVGESVGISGGVVGSFLNDAREEIDGVVSWGLPEMQTYCEENRDEDVKDDDEAEEEQEGERALSLSPDMLVGSDSLVLRVVKPPGGGGRILANETEVMDLPVYLADGAQVQFGDRVRLRISFRPLVVSIARNAFTTTRVREMEFMFYRLGATLMQQCGPAANLDMPQPIGMLHCVEVINNDAWCLMALASGYSIVQPRYVFEWFAALAQSASAPLSVLPPPMRFEVPIQCHVPASAQAAFYLRPESDICPFPLYPIPSTATRKRSRDALFKGRKFFFVTNAVEHRYGTVIPLCGGEVYYPEDATTVATEALQRKGNDVADDDKIRNGKENRDEKEVNTVSHYVVVDLNMEDAMQHGDERGLSAVRQILDDTRRVGIPLLVISEQSLFYSLLTNRFTVFEVAWSTTTDGDQIGTYYSHQQQRQGGYSTTVGFDDTRVNINIPAFTQEKKMSATYHTPRSVKRVPCSHRRGAVGRKERAASSIVGGAGDKMATASMGLQKSKKGPQVVRSQAAASIVEAIVFGARAFSQKEKPKLDAGIAGLRRSLFPSRDLLKHAQGCRTQSLRYTDKLKSLLLDKEINSNCAENIHCCLEDCREVQRKAECIIGCADNKVQRSRSMKCLRRVHSSDATVHRYSTPPRDSLRRGAVSVEVNQPHESGVRVYSPLVWATKSQHTPRRGGEVLPTTPRSHRAKCHTKVSCLRPIETPRGGVQNGNSGSNSFTPDVFLVRSVEVGTPRSTTQSTPVRRMLKVSAPATFTKCSVSCCSPRTIASTRQPLSSSSSLAMASRAKGEGLGGLRELPAAGVFSSRGTTVLRRTARGQRQTSQ